MGLRFDISKKWLKIQNKEQSFTAVGTKRKLTSEYLLTEQGGVWPLPALLVAICQYLVPGRNHCWENSTSPWLQQTINHPSLLFSVDRETGSWFSSLFSCILQDIKNFLAGGFHFLITLFFSVTDLVTGLQQYSDVFPSVVNLWLRLFGPRRRPGTNRSRASILKIEKHVQL